MSVALLCRWCLLTNFTGSGGGSGLAASAGFGAGVSAGRPNIGVARSITSMRVNRIFRIDIPLRDHLDRAGLYEEHVWRFPSAVLGYRKLMAHRAAMRDLRGDRDRGGIAVDRAAGVGDP